MALNHLSDIMWTALTVLPQSSLASSARGNRYGEDVNVLFVKILVILQTGVLKEIAMETSDHTRMWSLEIVFLVLWKNGSIVNLQT